MKILVFGADGFIGRAVSSALEPGNEVWRGMRGLPASTSFGIKVDLTKPAQIAAALKQVKPDVVINCAGIVENNSAAELNQVFTKNLLDQVVASGMKFHSIIILGSAAEYGVVKSPGPVSEDTPIKPTSAYGRAKAAEVTTALKYRDKHHLPITVARIFNPIGAGMHSKFIIPGIIRQVEAIREDRVHAIVTSRLDSTRDYIDVRDLAEAVRMLALGTATKPVYNVGAARSTTNAELIELILRVVALPSRPKVIETADPEPRVADCADISRIGQEFGWHPKITLQQTVMEIVLQALEADKIRLVVVGAGKAGELLAEDIVKNTESPFQIAGFIDDDPKKQGKLLKGLPVLGTIAQLPNVIKNQRIQEVLIAIPSERGKTVRKIVESTFGLKVTYKILPRLPEVLMQDYSKDYLRYVRRVKAEDLLGGEILRDDQQEITDYVKGQTILITGAAGSIGSELSRQIAAHSPSQIIFYDWWENGMFDLRNQLIEDHPKSKFVFVIGDIKDRQKLDLVIKTHRPTAVFHAAAYKHVPLMEGNPSEAIKNNILGTKTVAELAVKYKVKKFVLVSSDKAVNPTNVMGATKRAAEKVIHLLAESQDETVFCAVRFGNVINSNGSAIPIFEKQIEKGGPVTITHREVTRYFMTIPEAVHLILKSWVMGQNNDLFVLDMGEPIKIYDLAKLLIALHGYEPEKDIKIRIVGLRPGEKLFEEILVKEEETKSTSVKKIFRTKNYMNFDKLAFISRLNLLLESVDVDDDAGLKQRLKAMIPTYKPSQE